MTSSTPCLDYGINAPLVDWKPTVLRKRIGYRQAMPRVSAFYGVVIYMYWNEGDHPVAHFHAYHSGRRASVSVNGEVLAGSLDLAQYLGDRVR